MLAPTLPRAALPNDSFQRAPDGSGALITTELISGKEYEVVILAGDAGHLQGTRDSYIAIISATNGSACAASKIHLTIWNGAAAAKTMAIHGIWATGRLDVASAATVATRLDIHRVTTIPTGGTLVATESTGLSASVSRIDPGFAAVPASLEVRFNAPTATAGIMVGQNYAHVEESSTSQAYITQFQNMIRYAQAPDMRDLIVPSGEGLLLRQGPATQSAGFLGFRIAFSLY